MSKDWFLGGDIDPKTGERTDTQTELDPDDLTTHGVIVGMTGSGKTGLGVIVLEEALRRGTPVLVLDPKGDMGNLLLQFPDLSADSFEPWVETTGDESRPEVAEKTASRWSSGLESWGLGSSDLTSLKSAADYTIYTPGSNAGVPLNVLGTLEPPGDDARSAEDEVNAEIDGYVAGLLGLVDIDSDPLSSPEHILLANLIARAWQKGQSMGLETLIGQVVDPPIRKLGVFEVDSFFPKKERLALAMRLNGLVAKPGFDVWLSGEALDIQRLLWTADGKPRAAIVGLAHLSEAERQFVVTLVLSKVVTWMRGQPGSSSLRALVYMDEVFGFVPPTAAPPSKKAILTILKQARAFGVGMILSTQNPVDLDYKAMSNAGTWMVGRLQTERDKSRILEALDSASGGTDRGGLDRTLSGLGKRQFLLHSTKAATPRVFTTRWAMSFLRGPLTRTQIEKLMSARRAGEVSTPQPSAAAATAAAAAPVDVAADESPVLPQIAEDIAVHYVDPAAPWLDQIGGGDGPRLQAGLAARVQLRFDEARAKLDHREEWECVLFPLHADIEVDQAHTVDYDDRDLRKEAPANARYVLPEAPLDKKSFFKKASTEIKSWLHQNRDLDLWRNPELKIVSRIGESRAEFELRCDRFAQERADRETAKLRERFASRLRKAQNAVATAERQLETAEGNVQASRQQEVLAGVGSVLNVLLGGRATARGVSKRAAGKLGGAASRRSRSRKAGARVTAAQEKIDAKLADLEALEGEAAAAITDIDRKWKAQADVIEEFKVGLEKDDIHVEDVTLVWIPV